MLAVLSDPALLHACRTLAARHHRLTADLLRHLAEVDARTLYAGEGYPSMFAWCTEVLGFSEAQAGSRIMAARAGRRFPALFERIEAGRLHLCGARLLAPHLTEESCTELLDAASGRSKRDIERLLADRAPRPDAPTFVRRLPRKPDRAAASAPVAAPDRAQEPLAAHLPELPARQPDPAPLGNDRFKVQFTADGEFMAKLQEVQELLSHRIPDGDIVAVLDQALDLLRDKARKERFAECSRPMATSAAPSASTPAAVPAGQHVPGHAPSPDEEPSRHIPHSIRRAVFARDDGQCAFVSPGGRRCTERRFIEFHHVRPWALEPAHTVDNIELRCRTHNQLQARLDCGASTVADRIEQRKSGVQRSPRPP